jgi:DNA-directed RNA polymerase I subunit RPA1
MFQLLKSKCFYCHKLRMSLDRVRVFLVKLKLLEMGDVEGANTLDDSLQPSQDLFDEEGVGKGRNSSSSSVDAEPMLRTAEHKYRQYRRNATPAQRAASQDSFITDRQNQVIDAFQRACVLVKGCENCNALTAPLRQDQSIKVFQKPMPKRQRKFAESKLRQKVMRICRYDRHLGQPNSFYCALLLCCAM